MIRRPPRSTLFPTRRSSDLLPLQLSRRLYVDPVPLKHTPRPAGISPGCPGSRDAAAGGCIALPGEDRKSTRLNSSHSQISYAVFCLKKKREMDLTSYVSYTI